MNTQAAEQLFVHLEPLLDLRSLLSLRLINKAFYLAQTNWHWTERLRYFFGQHIDLLPGWTLSGGALLSFFYDEPLQQGQDIDFFRQCDSRELATMGKRMNHPYVDMHSRHEWKWHRSVNWLYTKQDVHYRIRTFDMTILRNAVWLDDKLHVRIGHLGDVVERETHYTCEAARRLEKYLARSVHIYIGAKRLKLE